MSIWSIDVSGQDNLASDSERGSLIANPSRKIWFSDSAPDNSLGSDGDFCYRFDTPATANQRLYNRQSGSWVGIV